MVMVRPADGGRWLLTLLLLELLKHVLEHRHDLCLLHAQGTQPRQHQLLGRLALGCFKPCVHLTWRLGGRDACHFLNLVAVTMP